MGGDGMGLSILAAPPHDVRAARQVEAQEVART
jgi:hypothetical protein